MPNGHVWPSATGGGLERGVQNYFNVLMARRQMELQERQLGLQERQQESQEAVDALERMLTLIPFLPKDVPISEMSGIHELIGRAFPTIDPNDPVMSQVVLNDPNLQQVINDMVEDRLSELPTQDQQRIINNVLGGGFRTDRAIELEEELGYVSYETQLAAMQHVLADPESRDQLFRMYAGFEQPVSFIDPSTGQTWTFDTAAGAQITGRLMEHFSALEFQWQNLGTTQQVDLAEELDEQMQSFDIRLGRPAALQIIRAWNAQQQGEYAGQYDPAAQEGPWYDLYRAYQEGGKHNEIRAMQVYTGALSFAENTFENMVRQSPVGEDLAPYLGALSMFSEELGKEDPELIMRLSQRVAEMLGSGVDYQRGLFGIGKRKNIVIRNDPQTRIPGAVSPGGAMAPDVVPAPGPPREQQPAPETIDVQTVYNRMMADIAALRAEEIDVNEIKRRWPNTQDQAFIIRTARGGG